MDTRWGCAVKSGALHDMKPFNRERFLFWMLAGIFIFEGLLFTAGFIACWRGGGLGACPELGERYESTFSVMVATTLALLTGKAVAGVTRRSRLLFPTATFRLYNLLNNVPSNLYRLLKQRRRRGRDSLTPLNNQPARQVKSRHSNDSFI